MDTAIIKDGNLYVAVSLFPVGYVGWGNSENNAISSLNDNLYDFCNWLSKPLPKAPEARTVSRYSGAIGKVAFKEDDGKVLKKYAELAMQTAFSYKCFIDSFTLSDEEEELNSNLFKELNTEDGIIGYSAKVCEEGCFPLLREFIFLAYKTAKEIFVLAKSRKAEFSDTFCFGFSY